MKNSASIIKKKIISSNEIENENLSQIKSTNINVLLNRVKLDQKKESRKKIIFTAATSLGLVLFGVMIF
jgi:hypothetical protein